MVLLMICTAAYCGPDRLPLRFNEDGTFKIVQFADCHWNQVNEVNLNTRRVMNRVLDDEKPDLVVFTGDNVWLNGRPDASATLTELLEPVTARGLTWAAVFGNHDDEAEGAPSKQQQMAMMQKMEGFVGQAGPEELSGVGNYTLPILAPQGHGRQALLYFLDSGAYPQSPDVDGYDWIRPDQVEWYRQTSRTFTRKNGGQPLPSLAFFHIPLPEYNMVWGRKNACVGHKNEDVASSQVNSGLLAAMIEQGGMMATFVGHDHINDYAGRLGQVWLCYGRGTGYDTYGKEGYPRGARVIVLHQGKQAFESWVRLEDGTVQRQLEIVSQPEQEKK